MYRWSSGALAGVAGAAAPPALGALRRSSDQTPDTSRSGPSPIDLPKSCASIPACASMHGSDCRVSQSTESYRLRVGGREEQPVLPTRSFREPVLCF